MINVWFTGSCPSFAHSKKKMKIFQTWNVFKKNLPQVQLGCVLIKRWIAQKPICQSSTSPAAFLRGWDLHLIYLSATQTDCNPLAHHPRIIVKNYSSLWLFREVLIFSKTTSPSSYLRIGFIFCFLLICLLLHICLAVKMFFPPYNGPIWSVYSCCVLCNICI